MQRTYHKTIVIHPHTGQFVINELPTLVLCGTVWVYGGMEGLPLTAIARRIPKNKKTPTLNSMADNAIPTSKGA